MLLVLSFVDPISAYSHVLPPKEAVTVGERDKRGSPDVGGAKGNYGTHPGMRHLPKLWIDLTLGSSELGTSEVAPTPGVLPKSLDLSENNSYHFS